MTDKDFDKYDQESWYREFVAQEYELPQAQREFDDEDFVFEDIPF